MMFLWVFLVIASFIVVVGCMHAAETPEMPVGKGFLNPCISDPTRADYWQRMMIPCGASLMALVKLTRGRW